MAILAGKAHSRAQDRGLRRPRRATSSRVRRQNGPERTERTKHEIICHRRPHERPLLPLCAVLRVLAGSSRCRCPHMPVYRCSAAYDAHYTSTAPVNDSFWRAPGTSAGRSLWFKAGTNDDRCSDPRLMMLRATSTSGMDLEHKLGQPGHRRIGPWTNMTRVTGMPGCGKNNASTPFWVKKGDVGSQTPECDHMWMTAGGVHSQKHL